LEAIAEEKAKKEEALTLITSSRDLLLKQAEVTKRAPIFYF